MPYEISECVGLRARPPRLLGSGAGGRARPGSCTAAGVRARSPPEWALWAGPAELRDPGACLTAAAREVRRPCPQAATGDRLGTPSADCLQLPGSREAGIAPHAPCRVCISPEKVFASLPQVERGVSKILGGDPKGDHFLYTNGKCVILRNIDVSTLVPGGACFRPCPASYLQSREILALPPPHLPVSWPGERGATPLLPRSHTLEAPWTGLD